MCGLPSTVENIIYSKRSMFESQSSHKCVRVRARALFLLQLTSSKRKICHAMET